MRIKDYPSTGLAIKISRDEGYSVLMAINCSRARALASGLDKNSAHAVNLAVVADRLDAELARAREACKVALMGENRQ